MVGGIRYRPYFDHCLSQRIEANRKIEEQLTRDAPLGVAGVEIELGRFSHGGELRPHRKYPLNIIRQGMAVLKQ